jgi:hypothetical protein
MEGPGIGNQCHVDALGYVLRNAAPDSFAKIVDHLANSRGGRVDPVYGAKMFACGVMIDVYGEMGVETLDPRATEIGTLDHKNGVIVTIERTEIAYLVRPGQAQVSRRHVAAHDDLGAFAKRAQKPAKAKRRTDAVTVRFYMRCDGKPVLVFN